MSEIAPHVESNKEDRLWALLCHLGTFATIVPFANLLVPLIIWLAKRDTSPLVADQGKECLNFQITMMLFYALAVVCIITVILFPEGIGLFAIIPVWHLVVSLIGAIKAWDGQCFRYPLTLRLL